MSFSRRIAQGGRPSDSPRKSPPRNEAPEPSRFGQSLIKLSARLTVVGLLLIPTAAGVTLGVMTAWLEHSPPIEEFEAYNPPEVTLFLDRHNNPLSALYTQQRSVVALRDMPAELPQAFVAIEDERFYRHFGIDPIGMTRAVVMNLIRGRFAQGASTITQQTARNLIDRIGREKSLQRKLTEVLVSIQMEFLYSKDQILEVYLNQIYLGSGTYGVEAAAQRYFNKSASRLAMRECAVLAGLPQLPERYSPLNDPDRSLVRRDQVLYKMVMLGIISDDDYASAVVSPLEAEPSRLARSSAPYFVQAVKQQLSVLPELEDESLDQLGWMVRTTIEPEYQRIGEQVLKEGLEAEELRWLELRQERWAKHKLDEDYLSPPRKGQQRMGEVIRFFSNQLVIQLPDGWRATVDIPEATADWFTMSHLRLKDGVDIRVDEVNAERGMFKATLLPTGRLQGALVCLDSKTGDVRALVGGRDYFDRASDGFFNRAMNARRQAGSTLKPFLYSAGLAAGYTATTILQDRRRTFAGNYTPGNYDNIFRGPVTLARALQESRNLPTIDLMEKLGLDESLKAIRAFDRFDETKWNLKREYGTVLGAVGVTPMELASGFQVLANGGVGRGPRLLEGLWNNHGLEKPIPGALSDERILSESVAADMTSLLALVMREGTGRRLIPTLPESLQHRIAGKSGTTNSFMDAWFAGYTPEEVVVVWVGFDTPMTLGPNQGGGRVAGPIFARYMAEIWPLKPNRNSLPTYPSPDLRTTVSVDNPVESFKELTAGNITP